MGGGVHGGPLSIGGGPLSFCAINWTFSLDAWRQHAPARAAFSSLPGRKFGCSCAGSSGCRRRRSCRGFYPRSRPSEIAPANRLPGRLHTFLDGEPKPLKSAKRGCSVGIAQVMERARNILEALLVNFGKPVDGGGKFFGVGHRPQSLRSPCCSRHVYGSNPGGKYTP